MNRRALLALWRAELRASMRERNILVNSILLPTLLYPVLLWVMFNGMLFVQGQAERMTARTVLIGTSSMVERLRTELADDDDIDLVSKPTDLEGALEREEIDAIVLLDVAAGPLSGNWQATVTFDSSRERSRLAQQRLTPALRDLRLRWIEDRAGDYLGSAEWQPYAVDTRNHASSGDMGRMLLGLMLPLYFVIMVAVGCMYPAIDATAGERERGTWETTLTLATSRQTILVAKYLYVTTLGALAGGLNLLAMSLTMGTVLKPMLGDQLSLDFQLPWAALPVLLLAAIALAAGVAAAMMLVAAFARDFKEGQAMVAPIYLLSVLPMLVLLTPDLPFSMPLALIPFINISLVVREAVRGSLPLLPTLLTFAAQTLLIGVLLALAARVLRFEEVLTGTFHGSLSRFIRQRLLKRGSNV